MTEDQRKQREAFYAVILDCAIDWCERHVRCDILADRAADYICQLLGFEEDDDE